MMYIIGPMSKRLFKQVPLPGTWRLKDWTRHLYNLHRRRQDVQRWRHSIVPHIGLCFAIRCNPPGTAHAFVLTVPDDVPTIQAALDAFAMAPEVPVALPIHPSALLNDFGLNAQGLSVPCVPERSVASPRRLGTRLGSLKNLLELNMRKISLRS
jgi:hypothetical protein